MIRQIVITAIQTAIRKAEARAQEQQLIALARLAQAKIAATPEPGPYKATNIEYFK